MFGFNQNMRGGRFENSPQFGSRDNRNQPRWQNRDRNGFGRGGGSGQSRFNTPGGNRNDGPPRRGGSNQSNRSDSERSTKSDEPTKPTSSGPASTSTSGESPAPSTNTTKSSGGSARNDAPSTASPRGGQDVSKKEAASPRGSTENLSRGSSDASGAKRDLSFERKQHTSSEGSSRPASDRHKTRDEKTKADGDKGLEELSDLTPLVPQKKFTGRCRLFVGNLTNDTTEEEFVQMFEKFGATSEPFLNAARGFGFIRMETRHKAEDARAALDGRHWKGRNLRVRFAAHGASLRVKYLSQHVSNEMLEEAFSQFGEVERAVIVVDDRGRPTGEGIVDFARKGGALSALNRINEGVFLMTTSLRPIMVEPLEDKDEQDGLPEIFFQQTPDLVKEREQPPRFAQQNSVEYEYGQKWKNLYQMYKEREELLKRNFEEEALKLDQDQETAKLEQHAAMLRQDLLRRQEELRRLEEQTQMEVQRRLELRYRSNQMSIQSLAQNQRMEDDRRRKELEMIQSRHRQPDIQQLMQQHSQQQQQHQQQPQGPPQQGPPPQISQPLGPPPPRQQQQEWPPQQQLRGEARGTAAPPLMPPGLVAQLDRARAQGINILAGPNGPPGSGPGPMSQGMPMPQGIPNLSGPPGQPGLRPPVRFEQPGPGGMGINGGPPGGPGPAGGMMREIGAKSGPQGGPGPHDEFFDPKRPRRF